jgi:hypothetical protein
VDGRLIKRRRRSAKLVIEMEVCGLGEVGSGREVHKQAVKYLDGARYNQKYRRSKCEENGKEREQEG